MNKTPLVFLNVRVPANSLVSSVCGNDLFAAANAVEYLSRLGHTQIAFIGSDGASPIQAERFAGYLLGLQRNGLPYQYDLTYFGYLNERTGMEAADFFLSKNKRITAFVCATEKIAEAFARCLRYAGRKIPDDVSVITFCDDKSAQDAPFQIASIVQDYKAMGEQAFNALTSYVNIVFEKSIRRVDFYDVVSFVSKCIARVYRA